MTFNLESLVLSPSLDSSLLYFLLLAYLRLVLFRDQWCFDVGKGKRVEYNGDVAFVSANKEHGRTSFRSTRPGLSTSSSLSALFGDAVRASIHDPDTNLPRLLQPSTPSISRPWRPPSWNLPLLSTERPSGLITLTQTWFSANASSSSTRYPTRRSPQPHFLLLDYSATPFPSLDESRRWSTSGVLPRRHLHPVDERLSSAVSLFRNSAPSP